MRKQRTFNGTCDSENRAYQWIEHVRQAFDVRKVVLTERYDKEKEDFSWQVVINFR